MTPVVLSGRLVTFDDHATVVDDGALYIDDAGRIEQVSERRAPPPAGYDKARVIATRGTVYPGLIDLHNHLAYNMRGLWIAPQDEPYATRNEWPDAPTYKPEIRDPALALGQVAGKAVVKWVELKALVGGVTAVQGSAKLDRPYEGWLVRNVELETFGTGVKTINQSVRTLAAPEFEQVKQRMAQGNAFLYHLSEGTSERLLQEYRDLLEHDCLAPQLLGIHSTALRPADFNEWGRHGGSVVWSPFSNLWLYAATTDVVAADRAGLRICLGADWSPSGSKHVLGELKVADLHNREALGGHFSDEALSRMATSNSADAIGWAEHAGRLLEGRAADVLVIAATDGDPYRALIDATEPDIRLVMVAGKPLYGVRSLMPDAAERITVHGRRRAVELVDPQQGDKDLCFAEVLERLRDAQRDPAGARHRGSKRGERPVRLELDMPWDEEAVTRAPVDLTKVRIPPIDPLWHDRSFFDAVDAAKIHGGRLSGLRAYYERTG
ncbi:MAG: amidohydrolase family protein [Thermoleophilaceae bacterium]|nr:amidohydrolase family protein [Thermoleophilaceae bacterium]